MAPITRHTPAPPDVLERLHENLASAGQALLDDEMTVFALTVDDHDGEMGAGCKGEIAFTSAHVSELWVSERLRGQGLGSALLADAEAVAIERGCDRIHLETRNPKARELYERLGYVVFGELEAYEGINSLWYLTKPLGVPTDPTTVTS